MPVHMGQLPSHTLKYLFEYMRYSKNKPSQVVIDVNKLNLPAFYLEAGKSRCKDCPARPDATNLSPISREFVGSNPTHRIFLKCNGNLEFFVHCFARLVPNLFFEFS
jgi:hypothetical protein